MSTLPVVRLEIEGMKHTILSALRTHHNEVEQLIDQALSAYCTSDALQTIVDSAVRMEVNAAVREEVRLFFSGSRAGRIAIREAIEEHLNYHYPVDTGAGEQREN